MGHHVPKHIESDIHEMVDLQFDDVLLAAQENDFTHFTGKIEFTPKIAKNHGIRPIAIFWGALNLFGGGQSSKFLLEHPEGFQVALDGSHRSQGCYVNPVCVGRIQEMIDRIVELGFEGYFVDEPTVLRDCFCPSCREQYREWNNGDTLGEASPENREKFRERCVIDYVRKISDYCEENHPDLESMCCLMPHDRTMWKAGSEIPSLKNIGTDIYWVNGEQDVEGAAPLIREMDALAQQGRKIHHEWLQCYGVLAGKEDRILQQGKILIRENPDALYAWAWKAQIGTTESSANPELAWEKACEVFRQAKG